MVLLSQSYMAAIDGNGVVWLSVELAEYEYVVDQVSEGRIRGRVEPKHENRPFELDFETGVVVAGTEFLPQELRRLGWRSQD